MVSMLIWWIPFIWFAVHRCGGVQVTVREERKFAMLFQEVVLQCQYSSPSTQTPVVQWWYKSYCRDRTRDSFSFPENLGLQGSELGATSHLDCADSSRTVRPVASGQGSSMTLAEHYKGRDIAIINKADLRIGQLQWGDSGVYFCKVVIADDLEGQNEDQVELLVLGKTGALDDLLPEFDVEIMPEWVFVGVVVLGSLLFLLLVGICWCQCCPHSCCCYVPCCCCPETCCCPRHLYEAGKAVKAMPHAPIGMFPPYYIPSVPTMVPVAPSSLIDPKMTATPSIENNLPGVRSGYRIQASKDQDSMKVLYYVEKELAQFDPARRSCRQSSSMSELSSLHEGESDFRQSYRQVQRKALPPIADHDDQPDFRPASSSQGRRSTRHPNRNNRADDLQNRWNPRSEHLQRKMFRACEHTGSLDELEQFAQSYNPRGRRGECRDMERDYGLELQEREHYPPFRDGLPRYDDDDDLDAWLERHQSDRYRKDPDRERPPPSPRKRRDTGSSERGGPRLARGGQAYDDAFLSSVLERKARGRGGRGEEDSFHSDTPSKASSKKSSDCYLSRSPSNRPEEEDSLPPYCEREAERYRTTEPAQRPFSYTRHAQGLSQTLQERRDERDKPRKVNTLLSRDSLIV
ncbi:immunoglobulin-like domain-containing receptor 2 isoform X2 [Megalops cyprinoides]|uniref:immunoglobulin-like domain-containing receptor 2 isoform X2 n=1 Tax=Megalops cyprinoides TaxID=118141 RepID=UPI001864E267|nr:immunoglobulin-like domain-containing receptor 2 isoform X2 [Megalops cyprinoides]